MTAGITGALTLVAAPIATGICPQRIRGCHATPESPLPIAVDRLWCRSGTAAIATASTCQQVLRTALVCRLMAPHKFKSATNKAMNNYKATPEQWEQLQGWDGAGSNIAACVCELRARVMALEAQAGNLKGSLTSSTPPPVATDEERLMDRVSIAIMSVEDNDDDDDDPNFKYTSAAIELGMDVNSLRARAAILYVAKWLREQGTPASGWAMRLEQEAGR